MFGLFKPKLHNKIVKLFPTLFGRASGFDNYWHHAKILGTSAGEFSRLTGKILTDKPNDFHHTVYHMCNFLGQTYSMTVERVAGFVGDGFGDYEGFVAGLERFQKAMREQGREGKSFNEISKRQTDELMSRIQVDDT
jgi:hypothetical protein